MAAITKIHEICKAPNFWMFWKSSKIWINDLKYKFFTDKYKNKKTKQKLKNLEGSKVLKICLC